MRLPLYPCQLIIEHVGSSFLLPNEPCCFSFALGDHPMADGGVSLLSGVFRPYEKLVEITIMGKAFLVPERNSVLRAFQFISPETIPYGRFCWNQECQYCRVNCQLSDEDQSRPILSCKFIVSEGMNISELAPELIGCLRTKLDPQP
jgi:hypothetical protein